MANEIITSQQNKLVKHIKGLQLKKNRKKYKQFIIEGIRTIEECFLHNIPIEFVLYTQELAEIHGGENILKKALQECKSYEVSNDVFRSLSDVENPQGIMALIGMRDDRLEDITLKDNTLYIVLDRIQDPGNMGNIIRTAEAAGVDGIILTRGCVDPYNGKTIRATMGAILHIPIIETQSNDIWVNFMKNNGVKLIASSLCTDKTYLDIDYDGRIAIVIGNEANGIDSNLLTYADWSIKIPIRGKIESLNASTAASILIYKAIEYRMSK